MSPQWASVLVTALVTIIGWAVTWGMLRQALTDLKEVVAREQTRNDEQDDKIGANTADIARMQGFQANQRAHA